MRHHNINQLVFSIDLSTYICFTTVIFSAKSTTEKLAGYIWYIWGSDGRRKGKWFNYAKTYIL